MEPMNNMELTDNTATVNPQWIKSCTNTTKYSMNFEMNLSSDKEASLTKIKDLLNQIIILSAESTVNVDYFRQNSSTNTYCN